MPVTVKAPHGHSEVEIRLGAGIRLLDIQRATAGAFLDQLGRRIGTRWIINREMLSTVARRTVRKPEECVIWNPSAERPEQFGRLRFGRPEADEFCRTFFQSNHCMRLQDLTEVVYMFNAFCKHAFNWLLNLQRPLDLVFCVLHPRPYREDWKQRMNGDLLAPDLFDDLEQIHWGIDVEPTKLWETHVAKLEAQRHKEKGDGYWQSVLDFAKRRAPDMQRLYAKFQATLPCPQIHPDGDKECPDPLPSGRVSKKSNGGNGVPVPHLHRKSRSRKPKPLAKAD